MVVGVSSTLWVRRVDLVVAVVLVRQGLKKPVVQRPLDLEVMLEDTHILHQVLQVQMISIALVVAVVPEE